MFAGKPVESLKVYNDPFGDDEICVELAFVDGQIECLSIGPGRPKIVSSALSYEPSLSRQRSDRLAQNCVPAKEAPHDA
jgi:hypothetical protein